MDPAIASLPVVPPVEPMLAKAGPLPTEGDIQYDPKWDGFRCIVFRADAAIELGSRNQRSLVRYFPEVLDPMRDHLPRRCVLDGELVVAGPSGLDFDALQNRLHPAASRVKMLAERTPASFVAFDVLALDGDDVRLEPLMMRRELLVASVTGGGGDGIHLSPATSDPAVAADWFARFEGAGLDGVIAKDRAGTYRGGERRWTKVKHTRSADCVVGGFRRHKNGGVGSLLLGLYDAGGRLHHIGVATGLSAKRRADLVDELAPLVLSAAEVAAHPWYWRDSAGDVADRVASPGARLPGGVSRWTGDRDLSWVPLRPERVCEIAYNQLQGRRLRHGGRFVRWRPDRDPGSCRYDQLETPVPAELGHVFGAGT